MTLDVNRMSGLVFVERPDDDEEFPLIRRRVTAASANRKHQQPQQPTDHYVLILYLLDLELG